jgi:MFS family permease
MKPLARYYAAAAGIDCATYMAVTGISYKATRLGASTVELGLLPAVFSIVYVAATLLTGRLSDRAPRITLARLGATLLAAAVGLHWSARGMTTLFLAMPFMAVAVALFWPSLQAALAEADDAARLNHNISHFNVAWSLGKGAGFLVAGQLLARFGFGAPFGAAVALTLLVALFLRPAPRALASAPVLRPPAEPPDADAREAPPAVRRGFLRMAWIANALAYGVIATLNYHYPKYLASLGLGASLYGLFQALLYLAETGTFLVLQRWRGWHYRRAPLYLAQLQLVLLVLLLPFVHAPWLLLLLAPGIGVVIGMSYQSSLYYSLHSAESRGRNTGLHEAVLGSGSLVVPFLGGTLAARSGQLATPYFVCAGLALLGVGGGVRWPGGPAMSRARRSGNIPRGA